MKTLTKRLKEQQQKDQTIFVPYIMAGAQGLEQLQVEIDLLAQAGASAIEIGIPFSDPVADGPVIQKAGLQALKNGVNLKKIIQTLQMIEGETPLIVMTYFNPIFTYGLATFIKELATTNVKGLIVPDLPYEHRKFLTPLVKESDIALIPLVALTSSKERIKKLTATAEGFVYAVAVNGVTGVGKTHQGSLDSHLAFIQHSSNIPVLAGFGISKRVQVERFRQNCAGVVVGSKIVQLFAEGKKQEIKEFIHELVH